MPPRLPLRPAKPLRSRRPFRPTRVSLLRNTVLVGTALLAALAACTQSGGGADVAMRIDGEPVHYGAFETYLRANVDNPAGDLGPKALSGLFDQFLDERLLVLLATERGLVRPGVSQREAIAYLLRDQERAFGEGEKRSYYQAHLGEFQRPERVRLRLILVYDKEKADQAMAELKRGEDFAQVAARFSQDPKAQYGGDQGLLSHEDLPPAFADTIFRLAPGEISRVVQAEYGFQIFKVEEKLPSATLSFEQVEPEIEQQMRRRALDETVASLLADARRRYRVELFPQNFPFDYQGDYGPTRS